ncbi:MAG: LamG-like jellyroll fold domain-containing protein [bacterium]|nr:LamG-like jellyroll fold domain-containing protein [bacterium]
MKKNYLFFCTLLFFIINLSAQDIKSGLIAHYKFNGDFIDASGLNNHGTNGGTALVTNRKNASSKAADFNGNNQSVTVNNSSSLSQVSNEVSISLWAFIEGYDRGIDGKDYAVLVCKANNENKAQYRIALTPNSFSLVNNGWLGEVSSSKAIGLNTWVHLAAVIKDSSAKVFINGLPVGNGILNISYPVEKNSPLTLGRDDAGGIEYFDGKLDDIRIYGRAISDIEVTEIYETLDYYIDSNTLDLIAYYPFDGSLNDNSGNLNHGAAFGGTYGADRFGRTAKAYQFSGNSQFVEVQNSSSLQLPTRQISFATWVKVGQFTKGTDNLDYAVLLCKSNSGVNAQFRLALTKNGISVINNGKLGSVAGPTDFLLGAWYHVTGVIEDSLITYYLNGKLVGSAVAPLPFGMSKNNKLYLGKDEPGGLEYLNGMLDETKIYARKLLAYEVLNMYNSGLINGIAPVSREMQIKLYPNPSNGVIKIECSDSPIEEVKVYNLEGQELVFEYHNENNHIELKLTDDLRNSLIMVRVIIQNQYYTKLVVVN